MMRIKKLVAAVAVLAAFGGGSAVRADQIFTDQAAFLANVQPGFYLETFDSLPQSTGIDSPLFFSMNGFVYTANTEGFNEGFFNVGPPGDSWLSTNNPADTIVFKFTSGNVTAVGGFFFETDFFGDVTTGGTITATLDNGTKMSVTDPLANSFVGFTTSSPILSLSLETGVPGGLAEFPTANDLFVGAAIPEPSALLLAALGLGCVLVGRVSWRRRANGSRPAKTTILLTSLPNRVMCSVNESLN